MNEGNVLNLDLKQRLLEQKCGFTNGSTQILFDPGGSRCQVSDVTLELGFQLLLGRQKIELFEDEKASPEGLVGEVTVLQVHS